MQDLIQDLQQKIAIIFQKDQPISILPMLEQDLLLVHLVI
jgi:hypothetical protein